MTDGRVLIVGNSNGIKAEVYTPTTGIWRTTGTPNYGIGGLQETLLEDGRVLATGGGESDHAELYTPPKVFEFRAYLPMIIK